jgi:FkbM family methyltransferase
MKKPRLKRAQLPDGYQVFCRNRDEVRQVHKQAQGYLAHGIEVGPQDIVFDVGANIGLFALEAAKVGATVHAFEPMPSTFEALHANAEAFGRDQIIAHQLALGARREKATFTYFPLLSVLSTRFPDRIKGQAKLAIEGVFNSAQLTPRAGWFRRAPRPLRRAVIAVFARVLFTSRRVTCSVETLQEQFKELSIARLALLKIDAEGAEMDVLKGLGEEDWPKIAHIVVEVHDESGRLKAMQGLLRNHGFNQIVVEEEPDTGGFGIYLLWASR